MLEVSAYETKTHLAELLRKVKNGERIIITKHQIPVAMMIPISPHKKMSAEHTIKAFKKFREGKTLAGLNLKELKEEGRR